MRKVLIITYYWPPSGGSGVQRWLKFSGYLPEYGYEPIIFTPENPSFINQDPDLLNEVAPETEVLKLPIWEPYALFEKFSGNKAHQKEVSVGRKKGWKQKWASWVRGNLFVPDPRMFWVRPAVKFLENWLPDSGVEMIVTTGPPHSMHLIGLKLKKKLKIKWLADFRDPWSEWDIMDGFYLSRWALKRHQKLERDVLKTADRVVSVGDQMDKDLRRLGARRSSVITNGFDPANFNNIAGKDIDLDPETCVIRHIGTIDDMRDPRPLIDLLQNLKEEQKFRKEVRLEFIGNVSNSLSSYVESNPKLKQWVSFRSYIPHSEVIQLYLKTDILLLVLAHSHSAKLNVTGKIFEYMASGVPVLGIGDPEGDAAAILHESGCGTVTAPDDLKLSETLVEWVNREVVRNSYSLESSPYSRKNLAGDMAKLLDLL